MHPILEPEVFRRQRLNMDTRLEYGLSKFHVAIPLRGTRTLALGGWTLESYLTHIALTTEPPGRLMTTAPDAEYQIPGNLRVVGLDDVGGFGTCLDNSARTEADSRCAKARFSSHQD